MLQISGIDVGYGDVQVLTGVSFEVNEGEIVTIVGANGAGKSTIIRTISGLLVPTRGEITFEGKTISRLEAYKIVELGIIQVPEGRKIFPDLTVWENLQMGGYAQRARKQIPRTLKKVYELFPKLQERKDQLAGTLSGGEQQMLAIGRGLMTLPKVLMLDEPSLGLAPIIINNMFEAIKEINKGGTTILLVEQDVNKALSIASRGYVLQTGKIVQTGTGQELLGSQQLREAYLGTI